MKAGNFTLSWVGSCLEAECSPGVEARESPSPYHISYSVWGRVGGALLFFSCEICKNYKETELLIFFQIALGFPGIFATVHLFKVTLYV